MQELSIAIRRERPTCGVKDSLFSAVEGGGTLRKGMRKENDLKR